MSANQTTVQNGHTLSQMIKTCTIWFPFHGFPLIWFSFKTSLKLAHRQEIIWVSGFFLELLALGWVAENSQLLRWKMGLHPKIRIWSQNPVMGCETWFSVHISTRTRLLTHVRTFSRIWKLKVYIYISHIHTYMPMIPTTGKRVIVLLYLANWL